MKSKITILAAMALCLGASTASAEMRYVGTVQPCDAAVMLEKSHNDYQARKKAGKAKVQQRLTYTADDIITKASMEKEYFSQSNKGQYPMMSVLYRTNETGLATHIGYGFKNEAYIYNTVSQYPTKTYVRGEQVENGTFYPDIVVPLPQPVLNYSNSEGSTIYYLDKMGVKLEGSSIKTFVDDSDSHEVRYVWKGDHYELENDADFMAEGMFTGLGMFDPEDNWSGFMDYNIELQPMKDKTVTPPADLIYNAWSLIYGDIEQGGTNGFHVNIGIDGDDFWMQGIGETMLSNSWVRGKINRKADGKQTVTFKPQYLGDNTDYTVHYVYMAPLQKQLVYDETTGIESYQWVVQEEMEMSFNEANRYLSGSTYQALAINQGKEKPSYYTIYQSPEIMFQDDVTDFVPRDPKFTNYIHNSQATGTDPVYGLKFKLPRTNNSEEILDATNLYYCIIVDGDPWYFYSDVYTYLTKDMSVIPHFFTDNYDFVINPTESVERTVYLYTHDLGDIGIMQVYRDPEWPEEEYYCSNIVYYSGSVVPFNGVIEFDTSGVRPTQISNAEAVSTEYYDLSGCRLQAPVKGINISRSIMSDGTVKTQKVITK